MKHIETFESHSTKIYQLSELKNGDNIIYQGSKYEVVNVDEFVVKVKSTQTNRETTLNQGQIEQYGINKINDTNTFVSRHSTKAIVSRSTIQ